MGLINRLKKRSNFVAGSPLPEGFAPASQRDGKDLIDGRVPLRNFGKPFLHHPVDLQIRPGLKRITQGRKGMKDIPH